jgi:hypothetical protein
MTKPKESNLIQINKSEIEMFKQLRKLSDTKIMAIYDGHERVVQIYENADSFKQWGDDRHKIEWAEKQMRMIYDYCAKFRKHLLDRI